MNPSHFRVRKAQYMLSTFLTSHGHNNSLNYQLHHDFPVVDRFAEIDSLSTPKIEWSNTRPTATAAMDSTIESGENVNRRTFCFMLLCRKFKFDLFQTIKICICIIRSERSAAKIELCTVRSTQRGCTFDCGGRTA